MNEQTMFYIVFFAAALLLLAVQAVLSARRQREQLVRRIREQWGKRPEREYSLEEFDKISHYYERKRGEEFFLDDTTWNDLGMDEVFMLLNTTGSAVGEEYLYRVLRTPEFSRDELSRRSALAEYFRANQKSREEFSVAFGLMGRKKRTAVSDYIEKLTQIPSMPLWPHALAPVLLIAGIASFVIRPSVGIIGLVGAIVINMVSYYKTKSDIVVYRKSMAQAADLVEYGFRLEKLSMEGAVLAPYREAIFDCCRVLSPVRRHAWILADESMTTGSVMKAVLDYFCMITHLDLLLFRNMTELLADKEEVLERLLEIMGQLELGLVIGSFRDYLGTFCEPEFADDMGSSMAVLGKRRTGRGELSFKELYHPLIEHAVANSMTVEKPVLVTGSNASGKSTFLKTVGIAAVLAQTIDTVPAKQFHSSFFRVYSSMALSDNLEGGESYYMVEIRSLKRILDAVEEPGVPVLCFIDEVLRGTNTVERIAASSKILESMAQKRVLPFAATHDIELTRLLDGRYANWHFEEQMEENDIFFSYELKKGPAGTRNAIRLLGIMGYDRELIRQASQMAERFVETGEWRLES